MLVFGALMFGATTTGGALARRLPFPMGWPPVGGIGPVIPCKRELFECVWGTECQDLFLTWKADQTDANAEKACREHRECNNYMYCYNVRIKPNEWPDIFSEPREEEELKSEEEELEEKPCDGGEVEECWLDAECQQDLEGYAEGLEPECWDNAACTKAFSCYAERHDNDEPCADEALACALDPDCSLWVHGVSDDVQKTDMAWGDCMQMDKCNALVECAALGGAKSTRVAPFLPRPEDMLQRAIERAYEEKLRAAVLSLVNAKPVWPIKEAMKETLKKAAASMLRSCASCQD